MADAQEQETVDEVKKGKKLSGKLEKVVEELEKLTVLELSEVIAALQERWGVSAVATAPTAPAGAPVQDEAPQAGGLQTVILTDSGSNKIGVIKALREINPNLGLKEAKDMSEKLPAEIVKDVKAEEAKNASDKLTAAGAKVEIK